jgi:localization factor PodJL
MMNSRVSWSVDNIDPAVRTRAEAAARRAGMSLNDWLNSTLGESTPPNFHNPEQRPVPAPGGEGKEVADIHRRLDSITKQIERISRPTPAGDDAPAEQGVARQLNDAISRLDARLSQISSRTPANPAPDAARDQQSPTHAVDTAAAQIYRASPPLSPPPLGPGTLDLAVAEITARQQELDNAAAAAVAASRMVLPPLPSLNAPAMAPSPLLAPPLQPLPPPATPGPDFSALELQLVKITSQIEALQRPDDLEQSIAAFRSELADIRHAITEAMPRQAIESIESEIRSLSRRIDENRQSGGIDAQALAGIERALSEIREVLRSLTPAEQLAGYDEAIRNLGAKLDLILRTNDDPGTVQQLEGAIAALRAIVSNIASNDALARLSEDLHLLSSKVDQLQLPRAGDSGDSFTALEQRIAALTATLEGRERSAPNESSDQIESALRALSDRIDRLQVGNDGSSTLAHLEQRVTYLLERLEASSDHGAGNFARVEHGLQDILSRLERQQHLIERQQETFSALAQSNRNAPSPPPEDSGLIELVKRELSDIRFSQTETQRNTQESLETVHNTLGHVVDRLAMIEGDLRTTRAVPPSPPPAFGAPAQAEPAAEPRPTATAAHTRPELPNPAATQTSLVAATRDFETAPRDFQAAPREFQGAPPPLPTAIAARTISEILEPHVAASQPRAAIAPDLPPDHPLEPGTRPGTRLASPSERLASPSERIAASESAIREIPAVTREPVNSSSFIAAARRAAQAAATQPGNDKASRAAAKAAAKAAGSKGDDKTKEPSTLASKIRSLLVGASVIVIVLGTFKMAMTWLDGGSPPPAASIDNSSSPHFQLQAPADPIAKPALPDPAEPSLTSPTPFGRQSFNNKSVPTGPDAAASVETPQVSAAATGSTPSANDVTGTITATLAGANGRRGDGVPVPPSEKLPDAIGGPVLRVAALKGDPAAAYEVGLRFAEGKGVPSNLEEAAKWYDRAARAGLVPAIFRIGTFYEKGMGVMKDVDIARRYYIQAADRGSAKAMHNLAVLDADGGGAAANYKSAAQWFRKAAERGVADSQFNLGILYARGIGVDPNLAESFKWFSLAAAQGDADAARKRDDVAKRLDPQSLAAAKLAIQTFTTEPQPDDAVNVNPPPGGWDSAQPQATAPKPVARQTLPKRTAAR